VHYKRKSAGKRQRRKQRLLALAVCLALSAPVYAAPTVTPIKANVIDTATDTTVGNAIYTDAVSEKTSGTRGKAGWYTSVTIGDGYIWRPVDIWKTTGSVNPNSNNDILVDNLVLGNGAAIDLVYFRSTAYDPDVNVYYDTDYDTQVTAKGRSVTATNLTLNGDFTYRTSIGLPSSDLAHTTPFVPQLRVLNNPTINMRNSEGGIRIFYQIGYVNAATVEGADGQPRAQLVDFSQNPASFVGDPEKTGGTGARYAIATFQGLTAEQATALGETLDIVGQATLMDAPLTKYLVTPGEITKDVGTEYPGTNNFVSFGMKGYTATNSGLASESVMAAADNQRALLNLHRFEDNAIFGHAQDLRLANQNRAATNQLLTTPEGHAEASLWAKMSRGKYKYDSAYGRSIDQYFSNIQVGFEKERQGDFYDGKLFYGTYLGYTDAKASFQSGQSDLTGNSLGTYASWQGKDGRFFDLTARISRLENSYDFTDSSGIVSRDNDYKAWNYGLNALYGYRKNLANGAYFEPQAGLSYARLGATAFALRNGVQIRQDSQDFLTGRVGVLLGKKNQENTDYPSDVYAKVMVNHDFIGAKRSLAGFGNSTLTMEPVTHKDTWVDLSLGATKAISRKGTAYLELTKTLGGEVKTDWMVNGGLQWYWDAGPDPNRKAAADKPAAVALSVDQAAANLQQAGPPASTGPAAGQALTAGSRTDQADTADLPAATATDVPAASAAADAPTAPAPATAGSDIRSAAAVENPAGYTFGAVLVEAPRPEWEKKLSPGTVTVVDTAKFAGEQKTLPDILQTVAGVFVQRVQGTGHYAVARVRGSTGAQVNIYIDGILVNSAAETGVDLSLIPLENVAKVEVYRGYVPARFAGAAIGGAINIVTKKPEKVGVTVKQGASSFGGYTGALETVAPLGSGTLMFNLSRDQARGDFNYQQHPRPYYQKEVDTYGAERTRQHNYYRNTSAMLKWQDDNWFAKFQYDRKNTGIPDGINSAAQIDIPELNSGYRYMITDKYRMEVGRRQTDDNLEWGWKLNYENNDKRARATSPVTKWTPAGFKYSNFDNEVYGAAVDGSWQLGNHMLEFLFKYSKETMDVNASYWGYTTVVPANSTRQWLPHYDIKNYYFQLQDNIALDRHKSLLLSPIVRAQKMEMNTFTDEENAWQYSYGVGLKKNIHDGLAVRATYGTYNKAPNFYEMFGDGSMMVEPRNAACVGGDVTWEHGNQFDLGVDWRGRALGADADMSLTYFNRHVRDLTSYFITFRGTAMYTNFGEGQIDGIEYETRFKWKNWELEQAVTYNNSKLTKQLGKYGTKESVDQPFTNIPKWETNTRLTYNFNDRKTSVIAELHYLGKVVNQYSTVNTEEAWCDPIRFVNLAVKHRFNPSVNLTVGVNDIGNEGPKQLMYQRYMNQSLNTPMPQQGRTYYATMQYTF
jgi:outer membrane autotransporter protein